jgi:1-acyl-sn-glycerol-3-phosphate acyltransferase
MTWLLSLLLVTGFAVAHVYVHRLPTTFWELALSLFYRRIHLRGKQPSDDDDLATLVISNHANAFIDPFAIQVALGKPLIRTVRADWLEHWLVRWFVRAVGAVPLARLKIDANNQNRTSFQQLNQALDQGKWVVVFPEGISHNRSKLHPFKKGAAHLAKQYVETTGKPIRVIQLGLYYTDKSRLHSDIWVNVAQEKVYSSVKALSDLSVEAEQWRQNIQDVLPKTLRRHEQKTLNWLNNSIRSISDQSSPFIRDFKPWQSNSQALQFRSWLNLTGLELSVLNRHQSLFSQCLRLFADISILVMGLPIALAGLLIHVPVATLHYGLTRKHSAAEDKWASSAYIIGTPLYAVFWLASYALFGAAFGLIAVFSGVYALYYWRNWGARNRALYTVFRCLSAPETRPHVINLAKRTLFTLEPQTQL